MHPRNTNSFLFRTVKLSKNVYSARHRHLPVELIFSAIDLSRDSLVLTENLLLCTVQKKKTKKYNTQYIDVSSNAVNRLLFVRVNRNVWIRGSMFRPSYTIG